MDFVNTINLRVTSNREFLVQLSISEFLNALYHGVLGAVEFRNFAPETFNEELKVGNIQVYNHAFAIREVISVA